MTYINELIEAAMAARAKAYAPYSGFYVGAALMTEEGNIYTGVNVENASYPVGICAERSAFSAAVSAGERNFSAIAIVGGKGEALPEQLCPPCGMCRQFMAEFGGSDFTVILAKNENDYRLYKLSELLPFSFDLDE